MVALHWIRGEGSAYRQFIANQVSKIYAIKILFNGDTLVPTRIPLTWEVEAVKQIS